MKHLTLGVLAHVDAGKTTLSEGILYRTGQLKKLGRVDHMDAFLDTDNLERERGITIFSKQAVFPLGETEVTLLDTPGHVDFSTEMSAALTACRAIPRLSGGYWSAITSPLFSLSTRWTWPGLTGTLSWGS